MLALSVLVSCGEPSATPAPAPSVAPPTTTAPSETSGPSESVEPPSPEPPPEEAHASPASTVTDTARAHRSTGPRLSRADRARVDALLAEARRLSAAGQHAEALAQLESALAIDRGAWRVACEAGYVAWRADDLAAAERHVREAMNAMPPGFVPDAARAPTAMCLFNAGLVAEAGGHTDDARAMWEESLRLRENATVRARLAALPPVVESHRPWETMPPSASIDELVLAMRTDFASTGLAGFGPGTRESDDIPLDATAIAGGGDALSAYRVHASFPASDGGQLVEALVVRGAGGQRVALLAQAYDAGQSESSTSIDFVARFDDVLPGGAPELVVELATWGGSTDAWGTTRHVLVCSVDLGALACIALPTAETSGASSEDEGADEVEGFCRSVAFGEGQVTFGPCPADAGAAREPAFIDGTHPLRSLLERGDLAWPEAWSPVEPIGS